MVCIVKMKTARKATHVMPSAPRAVHKPQFFLSFSVKPLASGIAPSPRPLNPTMYSPLPSFANVIPGNHMVITFSLIARMRDWLPKRGMLENLMVWGEGNVTKRLSGVKWTEPLEPLLDDVVRFRMMGRGPFEPSLVVREWMGAP